MPAPATVDEASSGPEPRRPSVQPDPLGSPAAIRTSVGTSSASVLCCGSETSTRVVGAITVTRRAVVLTLMARPRPPR
jgi:hypothetical protein